MQGEFSVIGKHRGKRTIPRLVVNAEDIQKLTSALPIIADRIKDGEREGHNNCKWWVEDRIVEE